MAEDTEPKLTFKPGTELTEEQSGQAMLIIRAAGLVNEFVSAPPGTVGVTALRGDQVVAFAWFQVVGQQAIGLGIASGIRSMGAGSALMAECFRACKEAGATFAMAAVRPRNGLVMWHLRAGYEVCGYSDSYYHDGGAAVIMRKVL